MLNWDPVTHEQNANGVHTNIYMYWKESLFLVDNNFVQYWVGGHTSSWNAITLLIMDDELSLKLLETR